MGNNTECLFICKAAGQYIWFALNICVKNIILSRKNNNTKVTGVKIGNIDRLWSISLHTEYTVRYVNYKVFI